MKIIKLHALLLLFISQAVIASPTQSLQSIQDAVNEYVKSSLDSDGKYQIDATPLDSHLQMPLCDQPLQVFPQSGEVKAGRNAIGVRCKGSQNWMIYTIVSVKSFKDVLLLSRSLRRNEIIHAEDIVSESRDISTIQHGYLVDPAEVVNKQAARNLAAGTVLNSLSYENLTLVKRGERVNIQLGKGGLSISVAGTAMMDGAKGDRISVKNMNSQKVIQAVVVDSGQVSVYF